MPVVSVKASSLLHFVLPGICHSPKDGLGLKIDVELSSTTARILWFSAIAQKQIEKEWDGI